jgi:hypothetical protein
MKTIIHTPTSNVVDSYSFYEKLGFAVLNDIPRVYTDGKAVIEINPDRFARAGIKCFKLSWEEEVEQLKQITPVKAVDGGYILSDAASVWIYLVNGAPPYEFTVAEDSYSALGNYAGLSLETTDVQRSELIYGALGFTKIGGGVEQGWTSYNNDGFIITLMEPLSCPHLFFNPSMTYFNGGKNLPVIEKIRELEIPIVEEITYFNKEGIIDNVIIRDPGGYGFFIFND